MLTAGPPTASGVGAANIIIVNINALSRVVVKFNAPMGVDEVAAPGDAQLWTRGGVAAVIGKIFAGIVMGVLVALLLTLLVSMSVQPKETIGAWTFPIGFGVMVVLALTAARGRYAWGRGLLLCGLLCLALPLATMAGTAVMGAREVSAAANEAQRAGAAVGTVIGGGIVTMMAGVVGFFLGAIFLVGAYFSLRRS